MAADEDSSDIGPMRRALELARRGRGAVEPNPMVGCVIARGGMIGEGFHEKFGGPHAEPAALAACRESPAGATAYVTLEPCCHTAKKTPPCVPLLIEAKLARVVVGCGDPNPQVAGRGIEQLRAAGIEVKVGVLENECRQLNAAFFALTRQLRPYVTLKWAQSADGKIAGPGGRQVWITNEHSTRVVHELRARCDAILVGINTVLCDDPLLTARGVKTNRVLRRLVLDSHLRCPVDSRLVRSADEFSLTIVCTSDAARQSSARAGELRKRKVEVLALTAGSDGHPRFADLLHELGRRAMTHLLVEPGPTLARNLMNQGFVDRVWVFRSRKSIGDDGSPAAAEIAYPSTGEMDLAGDRLTEHLNPSSPCFFKSEPSADLMQLLDAT